MACIVKSFPVEDSADAAVAQSLLETGEMNLNSTALK